MHVRSPCDNSLVFKIKIHFSRQRLRLVFCITLVVLLTAFYLHFPPVKQDFETCTTLYEEILDVKTGNFRGPPRSIILWSRWRMGSSFMGKLLASTSLKSFYSYETLHAFTGGVLWDNDTTTMEAMKYAKDLLQCRLQEHENMVTYFSDRSAVLVRDPVVGELCQAGCCHHPTLVEAVCQKADLVVSKMVKLRLLYASDLLEQNDLDTQVVFLTRDPRATMHSRSLATWCRVPACASANETCRILRDDLSQVSGLRKRFPARFHLLRYEDVSSSPEAVLGRLWVTLRLPRDHQYHAALQQHMKGTEYFFDAYSTKRKSREHMDVWRQQISWEDVQHIQSVCSDVLATLGLRPFDTPQQLRNTSLSSLLPERPPILGPTQNSSSNLAN